MGNVKKVAFGAAFLFVLGILTAARNPNPRAPRLGSSAAVLDIGVLVFREGLECILVLAAITAGLNHSDNGADVGVRIPLGASSWRAQKPAVVTLTDAKIDNLIDRSASGIRQ